jgi:hypothetical protein
LDTKLWRPRAWLEPRRLQTVPILATPWRQSSISAIDRGEAPTHLSQLFSVQMTRAPAIRLAGFFRIWEQKRVPWKTPDPVLLSLANACAISVVIRHVRRDRDISELDGTICHHPRAGIGQESDNLYPLGYGSLGSSMCWWIPVIQAWPEITGTTAGRSSSIVSASIWQ